MAFALFLNGMEAKILFVCHAELVEALLLITSFDKLRMTAMSSSYVNKKIVANSPTAFPDKQCSIFSNRKTNKTTQC
jgi:hypothetical protein